MYHPILPFALLVLLSVSPFAMGIAQDSGVQYLSAVLANTTRKSATFYRLPEGMRGELYLGRTYSMEGRLKAEGTYTDEDLTIEHGEFVFFHANGLVESRGTYVNGRKSGLWERFDERGFALVEKVYDPEALASIIYSQAQVMPHYRDGSERDLAKYVRERVTPSQGSRIKGTINTTFVVEKDGQLSGIRVVKGKSDQVDQQVVEALRSTGPWEPGIDKGQPVRVRMDLPIKF